MIFSCFQHANHVRRIAEEHQADHPGGEDEGGGGTPGSRKNSSAKYYEVPPYEVVFKTEVVSGSFFARDNIHNFIRWCRDLGVHEVLLFEADDLVLRKNEKHVIFALLEVARRGAR